MAKNCIKRSKLKLQKHQVELVNYLKTNRGVIAAFDVGTGKTLTAVTASQCFLDDNKYGKVVVVTPTSLQDNFKKELDAYGVKDTKRYRFFTMRKFANTFTNKPFYKNAFLIIDEAHNLRTDIKAAKSDIITASQVAVECAKEAEKVLLMTATPLYNNPKDLLNLVAMVKGENVLSNST